MAINWQEPGRVTAQLFDQAVQYWQDNALFIASTLKPIAGFDFHRSSLNAGPLRHWREARQFLFRESARVGEIPDVRNFVITPSMTEALPEAGAGLPVAKQEGLQKELVPLLHSLDNTLLLELIGWGRSSRRVFTLSAESVDTFQRASYEDFAWNDVLMPFKVFMIELPNSPLSVKMQDGHVMQVNGILVSQLSILDESIGAGEFICRVFFSDPTREQAYSLKPNLTARSRKLAEAVLKGDKSAVLKLSDELSFHHTKRPGAGLVPSTGRPFRISFDEAILTEGLEEVSVEVRKIVAGLCLYLAHTPGAVIGERDVRGEEWRRARKTATPRQYADAHGIRDISQTFVVRGVHHFNPRSGHIEFTDKTGRRIKAHARREHYRRPKYALPDAEKSVRVRATWVNRGMDTSVLPDGAATVIRNASLPS